MISLNAIYGGAPYGASVPAEDEDDTTSVCPYCRLRSDQLDRAPCKTPALADTCEYLWME